MPAALWTIAANPRRRKARKGRSAAQRAATRRMLAANRARRTGSNPRRRARRKASSAATTVRRVRRTVNRKARRVSRHLSRPVSMRGLTGGAMGLLKTGAMGAGGALATDVAMGFVNGFLPATMSTKLNADGTVNYLNYAAKFGVVLGLRALASKALSHDTANRMATGSVTVMAYELLRPMVQNVLPASMALGWYSPAVTFKAGVKPGMAPGVGNYQKLGVYQRTQRPPMRLVSPNATASNSR